MESPGRQVETEKGKRWLELARGLQGKFDGLMLEGLVDLPVPAGAALRRQGRGVSTERAQVLRKLHEESSKVYRFDASYVAKISK